MAALRQIAFYGKGISASPQSPKCTRRKTGHGFGNIDGSIALAWPFPQPSFKAVAVAFADYDAAADAGNPAASDRIIWNSAVLSDDDNVDVLRKTGVDIARRTVAKYRGAMNIHPLSNAAARSVHCRGPRDSEGCWQPASTLKQAGPVAPGARLRHQPPGFLGRSLLFPLRRECTPVP